MALVRRTFVRALTGAYTAMYSRRVSEFERALRNPVDSQSQVLKEILHSMSDTEFGREHALDGLTTLREFRERVPVSNYATFEPWITRQTQTRENVLTPGEISCFEKTSGSRGPAKWIPYNSAMLKTFENMFVLWSLDLLGRDLKLESGKVFFLISPRLELGATTPSGVPVGLRDDSAYLGSFTSALASQFFIPAAQLARSKNFVSDLAHCLMRERSLEVISIWSPSLLILICEFIAAKFGMRTGEVAALWPDLKLISCWDSASARTDADKLRAMFPDVAFQGKGLLATEGAMTVPWSRAGGFVPLVTDLFFEFEDTETCEISSLGEISTGRTYSILITSPNGLLRYRIGDLVRFEKRYGATPCLEFVGRGEAISDLVGEKLSAEAVDETIREIFTEDPPFALVFPAGGGERKHYAFVIDRIPQGASGRSIEEKLETCLMRHHHYAVARAMEQIGPVQLRVHKGLRETYFACTTQQGIAMGQIKYQALVTSAEMARRLSDATRIITQNQPSVEF